MRPFWMFLMAILAWAGVAQAQVAAPKLDPTNFDNPAVLPFTAASHAGVTAVDVDSTLEEDTNSDGVIDTTRTSSSEGLIGQLKLIGDGFALVVGGGRLEKDDEFEEQKSDVREISLAISIGDALGIGGARNGTSTTETDKTTGVSREADTTGTIGGVVLRLGEVFFLGGAAGKEVIETRDDFGFLDASIDIESEARIRRYGAGFYRRNSAGGYHAEVYRHEKEQDDLELQGTVTGIPVSLVFTGESETNGVTLEYMAGNFLFGVQSESSENRSTSAFYISGTLAGSSDKTVDEKTTEVTFGYVPLEGGALVVTYAKTEATESDLPNTAEVELIGVSLGMMF